MQGGRAQARGSVELLAYVILNSHEFKYPDVFASESCNGKVQEISLFLSVVHNLFGAGRIAGIRRMMLAFLFLH